MKMSESNQPAQVGSNAQLGQVPARWYVLDRDGLATLCKDADDAQDVAAAAWVQWPQRGPYRAALLGDLAAERERWAKVLGASCDEERAQLWEAAPGGGCSRALDAEADVQRLRAAIARACAGYPADDAAPTCVAILRAALGPNVGAKRGGAVLRDDSA
jgi:hypothetical protein